jgi:hypothetical protein
VLGAVAELERSIILERMVAGQRAAKKRGVKSWETSGGCGCSRGTQAQTGRTELARNSGTDGHDEGYAAEITDQRRGVGEPQAKNKANCEPCSSVRLSYFRSCVSRAGLARRCDPVCVRGNDCLTIPATVLGANAVDGAMQLAALCLVHLIPPVRHRFPEARLGIVVGFCE